MDQTPDELRASIEQRYERLARFPDAEHAFPVGAGSAVALGYPAGVIERLPGGATESFAGVGNPFALAEIQAGQTVLDLGCGAGMDALLAAERVGESGRVIGIDITEAMVQKASRNAEQNGAKNVRFEVGDIESLPLADETVDVAISNGVFNLCLNKPRVVAEVWRVLRRGGQFLMADVLLEDHVTPEKVRLMGSWSG